MSKHYPEENFLSIYFNIKKDKSFIIIEERTISNYMLLLLAFLTVLMCFIDQFWIGTVLCVFFLIFALHKTISFYLFCGANMNEKKIFEKTGSKYSFSNPRVFSLSTKTEVI